mmetsp:Transcript_22920/g.41135  ORF Transcript_22920/g.41135 Transcript_22920/m.41135 type:complete len:94 (+) Transcript_22920:537-818(+)
MANKKHCSIWVVSASGGISITSWLELEPFTRTGRNTVAGDANAMNGRIVQRTFRRFFHVHMMALEVGIIEVRAVRLYDSTCRDNMMDVPPNSL